MITCVCGNVDEKQVRCYLEDHDDPEGGCGLEPEGHKLMLQEGLILECTELIGEIADKESKNIEEFLEKTLNLDFQKVLNGDQIDLRILSNIMYELGYKVKVSVEKL